MGGVTIWLTGFSGAGKSTLGCLLAEELERDGRLVDMLDADAVRPYIARAPADTRDARNRNVESIGWIASRLARTGAVAVVASISPYADGRARARELTEAVGGAFIEVWVATPLAECERRDTRGFYARARSGELKGFTGIDDPYDPPATPAAVIDTVGETPPATVARLLSGLGPGWPAPPPVALQPVLQSVRSGAAGW